MDPLLILSALAPCCVIGICWNRQNKPLSLEDILKCYYARQGGISHLNSIQSMRVVGVNYITGQEAAEFHLYKKAPNKSCIVINPRTPAERVMMAFNGKYPWVKEAFEAPQLMPEASAKIFVRDAHILSHLAHSHHRGIRLKLMGETMVRNEYCYQINVHLPEGGMVEYYIGCEDFLEKKISHQLEVNGKVEQHDAYLSQYNAIGKLMQPFLIETFVDNEPHSMITVREMQINVPMEDSWFDPEEALVDPVTSSR